MPFLTCVISSTCISPAYYAAASVYASCECSWAHLPSTFALGNIIATVGLFISIGFHHVNYCRELIVTMRLKIRESRNRFMHALYWHILATTASHQSVCFGKLLGRNKKQEKCWNQSYNEANKTITAPSRQPQRERERITEMYCTDTRTYYRILPSYSSSHPPPYARIILNARSSLRGSLSWRSTLLLV